MICDTASDMIDSIWSYFTRLHLDGAKLDVPPRTFRSSLRPYHHCGQAAVPRADEYSTSLHPPRLMSSHFPPAPSSLNHVQWTRYIQAASLTLVLYDHLLTLPKEINLVWRGARTWSWPRLLFFAARYVPTIALIVNTYGIMNFEKSDRLFVRALSPYSNDSYVFVGKHWLFFQGWLGYFLFAGVQVISQMRLWAMYRSDRVLIWMTALSIISLTAMGIIEGIGFTNIHVTSQPTKYLVHICGPSNLKTHLVWAFWLPPLIVETITIILVAYKAIVYFYEDSPDGRLGSRVIVTILQYSVIYFVLVFGVYITNLILWKTSPVHFFELAVPLTFALPSVAANRMLFTLRTVFYDKHGELPAGPPTEAISLTAVNPERGLVVQTYNPLNEFDSFFGEARSSRVLV